MNDKIVLTIIESPYAASTPEMLERNLRYARRALADSLKRGEAPFASHLLYTQPGVLDDTIREERALGMNAGFAWGKKAERWTVYVDYGISPGMHHGMEVAQTLGLVPEVRSIGRNEESP